MAIVGNEMMPFTLNQSYNSAYFVIYIVISNFFLTNLFVGVVLSSYNREKDNLDHNDSKGGASSVSMITD